MMDDLKDFLPSYEDTKKYLTHFSKHAQVEEADKGKIAVWLAFIEKAYQWHLTTMGEAIKKYHQETFSKQDAKIKRLQKELRELKEQQSQPTLF